jgi:hypothetical protein
MQRPCLPAARPEQERDTRQQERDTHDQNRDTREPVAATAA